MTPFWCDTFDRWICESNLQDLESLTLRQCLMRVINIESRALTRNVLSVRSRSRVRVSIKKPILVDFPFVGPLGDLLMNARNMSEAEVNFTNTVLDMNWYTGLIRFLRQLDSPETLILHVQSQTALLIPDKSRLGSTALIPNVNDLTQTVQTIQLDRISNLPQDLSRIILSSVRTIDATRMGAVSRHWNQMWANLNVLDFDEESSNIGSFYMFVWRCLKLREQDMVNSGPNEIRTFRLAMATNKRKIIGHFLKTLRSSNVQHLELRFNLSRSPLIHLYTLPRYVLPSKALTSLRLTRVNMTQLGQLYLPFLESALFRIVKISDEVLSNLLSFSPKLKNLTLDMCSGLHYSRFSSSTLESLEINSIQPYIGFKLSLLSLENLIHLSLSKIHFITDPLSVTSAQFPRLESLNLRQCPTRDIEIKSSTLTRFVLSVHSEDRIRVKIEAPSLVDFRFVGPLVDLSMNARNISEAEVNFSNTVFDMDWYSGLISFLRQLDNPETLILHVQSQEALVIPDEAHLGSTSPIRDVNDLTVSIMEPSETESDLQDSLDCMKDTES